jgi:hypothetical protein
MLCAYDIDPLIGHVEPLRHLAFFDTPKHGVNCFTLVVPLSHFGRSEAIFNAGVRVLDHTFVPALSLSRDRYARCAVAVIRALKITNTNMRYEALGRAIGLISDGDLWEARHRQQVEAILSIAAAVEKQRWGGGSTTIEPLDYSNVFRSHTTASARSVLAGPSAIKAHTTITKRLLNIVSTNAVG